MKFKKPASDLEDAKKLIEFMKSIYFVVDGEKPIGMEVITDDKINYNILVFSDPVISKLDEDRGLAPTIPWNMYTFVDLMHQAGYDRDKSDTGETVSIFYNRNMRTHCSVCVTDCKYTGSIVHVPVKICGEYIMAPTTMCLGCAAKFDDELKRLVDTNPENCEHKQNIQDKTTSKKKGIFDKIFSIFRK